MRTRKKKIWDLIYEGLTQSLFRLAQAIGKHFNVYVWEKLSKILKLSLTAQLLDT